MMDLFCLKSQHSVGLVAAVSFLFTERFLSDVRMIYNVINNEGSIDISENGR
jgi:hypothetical protein